MWTWHTRFWLCQTQSKLLVTAKYPQLSDSEITCTKSCFLKNAYKYCYAVYKLIHL